MAIKIILDTDMGGGQCTDVDDVGTLCMIHALVERGEAELLAVVVNTMPPLATAVVSVLNHFYGRDDVPIGALKANGTGWGTLLTSRYNQCAARQQLAASDQLERARAQRARDVQARARSST
jgi:hypothetical protein